MRKLIVHDIQYDLDVSTLQWVVQIRALMDGMPYTVRRYVSLDTIHTSDHPDVLYERCIEQAVHELIEGTQPDEVVYENQAANYFTLTSPTATTKSVRPQAAYINSTSLRPEWLNTTKLTISS